MLISGLKIEVQAVSLVKSFQPPPPLNNCAKFQSCNKKCSCFPLREPTSCYCTELFNI